MDPPRSRGQVKQNCFVITLRANVLFFLLQIILSMHTVLPLKVQAGWVNQHSLNSVAAELIESLKNPVAHHAETIIQSHDSSVANGAGEALSAHVAEDRISSFHSQDNCGTGFEVVKVTEQETVNVKGVDDRIVHGNRTRVPWQVYLRGEGESHVTCGGALIKRQWILTAAHCDTGPNDDVFVGLLRAPSAKEKSPHQIDRIFNHPDYKDADATNDFTLIKLKSPVGKVASSSSSDPVNSVCLPVSLSEFEKVEGYVSGYGHIKSKNGPFSPYLLSTRVNIMSSQACNKITMEIEKYKMAKSQMCAAGIPVAKEPQNSQLCQGDSGGPLVVRTTSGKHLLVGIVSFAYDICAEPGFFGKVSHVMDWVSRVIQAN